jgi:hypothetical protein
MGFNLTEYIKRNLINGFTDGTWSESKVSQLCVGYLDKGHLTVEDIEEIDEAIQKIKEDRANAEKTVEDDEVQAQEEDSDNGELESVE